MQEVAPRAVGLVPEVQVDGLLAGLRLHAESAGQLLEVGGERRDRGIGRRLAHDLADDQAVAHELERQVRTHGEAGADGLVQLGQGRHGAAAHRGERLGEADGFDQVRGGGIDAFVAEERADPGHPRDGERFRARPEVGVPAGRLDAGAVAGLRGQAIERPRDPGGRGLHGLRQRAQRPIVLGGGRQLLERGRVPGAAHDGDVREALLGRFADAAPHRCLALERDGCRPSGRAPRTAVIASETAANRSPGSRRDSTSRSQNRSPSSSPAAWASSVSGSWRTSSASSVGPLPCFAVVGFGRFGGCAASAIRRSNSALATANWAPADEVDEPGRDAVLERPAQGHPLGAELRERVERRDARLVGRVDEERHRRAHPRVLDQVDQVAGVRRPLDEEGVRLQPLELGQHAPRGAGAVVADAEDRGHRRAAAASRPPRDRLVEVAPAVAFLHHRLEVLAPHGGVLDRIADDRAGQAGGHVAAA